MTQIIPSIFVDSAEAFIHQSNAVTGVVETIQLDIADGAFVEATTWADPSVVGTLSTDLKVELHLMCRRPIEEMLRWGDVPHVRRVLFPYEGQDDIEDCINLAMDTGWMPSLVLNPETDASVIAPYADHLFGVMLMGIHPGAQGQTYLAKTTKRLAQVHEQFPHLFLELDGGVHLDTLEEILSTGLDAVCPGSAIFGSGDPKENVETMRTAIHTFQNTTNNV